VADPEERSGRSCRAFEKAAFIPMKTVKLDEENVRRRVMRLSLTSFMVNPRDEWERLIVA
jgi:hypothetical protein